MSGAVVLFLSEKDSFAFSCTYVATQIEIYTEKVYNVSQHHVQLKGLYDVLLFVQPYIMATISPCLVGVGLQVYRQDYRTSNPLFRETRSYREVASSSRLLPAYFSNPLSLLSLRPYYSRAA